MRCGSVVLSLLLLASFSQAQLIGTTTALAVGAVGLTALGGAAALGAAVLARSRGGGAAMARGRGRLSRFGRRRRAVPVEQEEADDVEEQSVIWGSVAAADQDGCALKLICLLEAADSEADDDEQTILSFFGELGSTDRAVAAPKLPYEAAGWLGKRYGAGACQDVYGAQCPHSKADMMQLIARVWSNMTSQQADAEATSA